MSSADYKIIGKHYSKFRQPDLRIAKAIHAELDEVSSIVNIGAGTGSYEPLGKVIAAVEPSESLFKKVWCHFSSFRSIRWIMAILIQAFDDCIRCS